ncbi:hypothetical protein L1987_58483 [Smallanthus sonchifolius]|uniref:Uncharacterized protein n=1 Tax=Smallanthus sonchifolius TaxID=185202 RepID=A0ACB9DFN1_9ASTR|nr:hypothetical protein L1987_58483 [Smallanthus sonchifolius]
MVGQVVTGVIDGVFEAGYLISIRVGANNTLLRGLVFQQGHYCPITPANDVQEHLKNDDCGHGLKNEPIVQDVDHESAINEADKQKQEGEKRVFVTRVETGEVIKIDVNQDPNQGVDLVATDVISNQD